MSFALDFVSAFDFISILGRDIGGRTGGFFAIESATINVAIKPTNAEFCRGYYSTEV